MRFRRRAARLAIVVAMLSIGCGRGGGLFAPQYEYEEDLTLSLDGSATLVVNSSIPALVALRGLPLDPNPKVRPDIPTLRQWYTSPYAQVQRVSQWTRNGRRYVGVRLRVPDIRLLSKAVPFSWMQYELQREDATVVFRETLGAPAFKAGTLGYTGWKGGELVAFRLHLPSRINYYNARDVDTNQARGIQRGNIITWEQHLPDRLEGKPIAWQDGVPGVMEVRMDNQSILYRTLWLFGLAFLAAVAVLALLIWLTMRKGRGEDRGVASR